MTRELGWQAGHVSIRSVFSFSRFTIGALARGLHRDERGGVLAYVALALPILMGFAGLAVDVSSWYAKHRLGQKIVDAAVLGGAAEIRRVGTMAAIEGAAFESAAHNGYREPKGHTLNIYWPPQNGPFAGDDNFVEGVFTTPGETWFTRLFLSDSITVRTRAVGTVAPPGGSACIYALDSDEDAREGVRVTGNSDVNIDCAIHSNAPFDQGGSSCAAAAAVYYVEQASSTCLYYYDEDGSPTETLGPTPTSPIDDPLETFIDYDAIEDLYGSEDCLPSDTVIEGGEDAASAVSMDAGTYCGNLSIHGFVVFEPGFYKIEDGALTFNAQSNSSVAGGGPISFYIESGHRNDTLKINGGAVVEFRAYTAEEMAAGHPGEAYEGMTGMLFMQNGGDYDSRLTVNGTSTVILDGIIYAPYSEVQYNGTGDLTHSNLVIVADTVDINGDSDFRTGAEEGTGSGNPAFQTGSKLVE